MCGNKKKLKRIIKIKKVLVICFRLLEKKLQAIDKMKMDSAQIKYDDSIFYSYILRSSYKQNMFNIIFNNVTYFWAKRWSFLFKES